MRLLDLFCGAGGCAVGYHRAGFEVVGVDHKPQPRYPFAFVQAEALDLLDCLIRGDGFRPRESRCLYLQDFDAIHASPPCQAYSTLRVLNNKTHPDLLPRTRDLLEKAGKPWVIENVIGAPLTCPVVLCGTHFGLKTRTKKHGEVWLKRHRLFEASIFLWSPGDCRCQGKLTVPVYGGGAGGNRVNMRGPGVAQAGREVMGIDWMTRNEIDQAIPPAYTEFIGKQLMTALVMP